jgi:hypothetical protein
VVRVDCYTIVLGNLRSSCKRLVYRSHSIDMEVEFGRSSECRKLDGAARRRINPGPSLASIHSFERTFLMPNYRCYIINAISLALGFAGNIFLVLNFGNRIRYIIALPMSIILWILSAALVSENCVHKDKC